MTAEVNETHAMLNQKTVWGYAVEKLHEAEEAVRTSRRSGGPAINGFELWFAVLIILNSLSFFAERELPDLLPATDVAARLYMVVAVCFFIAGLGIVAGLVTRLVIIEIVGIFTFTAGLLLYGFLLVAFAFSPESLSMVFILAFGIYACLGRLNTLKRL